MKGGGGRHALAAKGRAVLIKMQKIDKKEGLLELCIGIAEGGARTHDLEVDLFAVIRATRSTD